MEEILERQLLIRGRAFAAFSTIEKALAGRMLCRPAVLYLFPPNSNLFKINTTDQPLFVQDDALSKCV